MSTIKKTADKLVVGGVPRADLLPTELKAEDKLRSQRRGLVGIAILAVLLVGAAYAFTSLETLRSKLRVEAASAETASLQDQQRDYAEVTVLQEASRDIAVAQLLGVSTEIDWKDYLLKVQGSLPAGTTITSVTGGTAAPGSAQAEPGGPLQAASLATINFAAISPALPEVSSWIENLAKLPGFADANATSIILQDDGTYQVSMVMHVNYEAVTNRFGADDEAEAETTDEEVAQ